MYKNLDNFFLVPLIELIFSLFLFRTANQKRIAALTNSHVLKSSSHRIADDLWSILS